ncbi:MULTISPECIES: WYL domain-containing protein [Streptomyces]|uniref:WYL domain-containing protein n=1 Tax=Streptomyces changanensis TaxID=2964669 RepID=A0ABY5N647_9ACTN|nr:MULTISPECIES: WYL domain-containing protein [Streptomyces]UUS31686.1 WYL domain-containing protein [Streptomyces changanensis]
MVLAGTSPLTDHYGTTRPTRRHPSGTPNTTGRDRLTPRTPNGPRFTPRELPDEDLARYTSRAVSSAPYRHRARFTLRAPAEAVAEHLSPTSGTVTALGPDTCEPTCGSDSLDEPTLWVDLLVVPFEAHEPPELLTHLRTLADRLAAALPPNPPRP